MIGAKEVSATRAARRPPGPHRRRQPDGQRDRRPRPRRRPRSGPRRRRRHRGRRATIRAARRARHGPQGPRGDGRLPDDVRLAAVRRPPTGRRLPARRPHEGGRRGRRRQDEHAGVRRRLAHVQPRLRRHPEPVGPRPVGRRIERRRGRRARLPDGGDRRRQRHRRLAAQPGGVEQRRRVPSDGARRAPRRTGQRRGCRSAPRVRWAAPSTTWPCCSTCSAAPDRRDPMHRPFSTCLPVPPPERPLRVAWSPDLGVPVEPSQLDVLAGTRQAMVDLGWDVVDDEPELALASDCFRVLRAWNIANGPTARFHDRMDEIKATIHDEIAPRQRRVARPRSPPPTPSSPRCGARRWPSSTRATTCSPAP